MDVPEQKKLDLEKIRVDITQRLTESKSFDRLRLGIEIKELSRLQRILGNNSLVAFQSNAVDKFSEEELNYIYNRYSEMSLQFIDAILYIDKILVERDGIITKGIIDPVETVSDCTEALDVI